MEESKHAEINEAYWDKWAGSMDSKGWRYDYLRKCQSGVISLLDIKENISILDIGCGTGWALGQIAKSVNGKGLFYGVDLSTKMIEKAKENFKEEKQFHFIKSNAESISLDDNLFDIIICINSFHHYLNPDKLNIIIFHNFVKKKLCRQFQCFSELLLECILLQKNIILHMFMLTIKTTR